MDGYADLLEDIRKEGGELMWITRKKDFLQNLSNKEKRTPDQLKQDVLNSERIRHVIDQLLAQNIDKKRDDIVNEAKKIIDEMAHQFDLKYVRFLGYTLMKIFSKIYKHIYYNKDILANLECLKTHPVVFLPLHRSYMDFLLVSIICFHKNIQLPTIAAGQDFLGLSFLSQVIRHNGGFFIRRSFGSDQLYWAIFHQYVQEHLSGCDRPVEFFIEGTRSRTSKSLPPKQGMLSTCLELYMKSRRVNDIYLIPISLTYEKLLEEILYSNELLGIPKPKETVSGLVKARTILSQCFGTIFVNFAKPISVREALHYLEGPTLKNRLSHTLTPSFIFELTQGQQKTIEKFSYNILIEMLRNQIVQPISLIATCVLLSIRAQPGLGLHECKRRLSLDTLSHHVDKLKQFLLNLGIKVYYPVLNDNTLKESDKAKQLILDIIELHSNLFELNNSNCSNFKENLKNAKKEIFCTEKKSTDYEVMVKQHDGVDKVFENASIFIAVCSYRNQLVNCLVRISFVCNSLLSNSTLDSSLDICSVNDSNPFVSYKFLISLFSAEFIFNVGDELKDFNEAISFLLHTNMICIDTVNQRYQLIKFNLKIFLFFSRLFLSFMQNYMEIYSVDLFSSRCGKIVFDCEKKMAKSIQGKIFTRIENEAKGDSDKKSFFDLEVLSLNLISNSIMSLRVFNAVNRLRDEDSKKSVYEMDLTLLGAVKEKLNHVTIMNRRKIKELYAIWKTFDASTSNSERNQPLDEFNEYDYDLNRVTSKL